ncbi:PDF receptor-like isoform X2 [Eriocheir sinensis]|uniref:PDF receptor-like isoform X2 n=1 Tax=Eriocheir sinensis TaxID=95602 RepID=UPI0021C9E19B|nr:PDF receptor-like isoform X2 [Eriocheir sinensis]
MEDSGEVSGTPLLAQASVGPQRGLPQPSGEGQSCLQDVWNSSELEGVFCNASWDTLHCWPATPAGRTVKESCANVFSDVPALLDYPDAVAYRECGVSGAWLWDGWTNYSQCLSVIEQQAGPSHVLEAVRYITFIGGLLSLFTLAVTIFIFSYYRALECDRLRVHRNLVAALIIRFLVMLVLTEPFVSRRRSYTYRDVDWLCKTLLALRMYAQMASINWMFVEGLFLHSRLTSNVFHSGAPFPLYYAIGWGAPLVFIVGWGTTMALHHPAHCWRGYSTLSYVWILVGPMVAALMVNLVFLVNIIRILVTKLRANDTLETEKFRFHHRRRRVLLHYHSQRRQHPPNNNSLQQEETLTVPDEAALRRSRSLHTGGDMSWRPHRLSREQESTTAHNRESSPLLRHECAHKQAIQQPVGSSHLPRHHLVGSRRSVHTNSLQHYPSVGYAANRPEFNLRKAIRATVVLFPLLGITNLLFAVNPGDKGDLESAYMLTNAILQSSQAGSSHSCVLISV